MTLAQYGYGLMCVGFGSAVGSFLPEHSRWMGATAIAVGLLIAAFSGMPQS